MFSKNCVYECQKIVFPGVKESLWLTEYENEEDNFNEIFKNCGLDGAVIYKYSTILQKVIFNWYLKNINFLKHKRSLLCSVFKEVVILMRRNVQNSCGLLISLGLEQQVNWGTLLDHE